MNVTNKDAMVNEWMKNNSRMKRQTGKQEDINTDNKNYIHN